MGRDPCIFKLVGISLCLVTALTCAPPAWAEDRAAARQAFIEASKYYDLNQFTEALAGFKKAYWNYENPAFLFNIAQCHRALGQKSEAVSFYRSYLRKAADAPNRGEVERVIASLEAAIKEEKTLATAPPQGTIATTPSPAPAAVSTSAATESLSKPVPAASKPVIRKPWFWVVVVGAAAAAATAVAVGVVYGSSTQDPVPSMGVARGN
jgi:tetratricopeptide (TPR) repeat protein